MAYTKEDTFSKVAKIIADKMKMSVETITLESTFKDLGTDSLDTVDIIMSFEETFGIEISDEEAEKIQSVGQAVELIHGVRSK